MAETVRDAFEEWAHADHRRLEPNEYEADDRTPGNNHYYDDDTTNQAYIGWCAAWNRRATDPAVPELVEALEKALALKGGWREAIVELEDHCSEPVRLKNMRAAADQLDEWGTKVRALITKHAAKP